MMARRLLRWIAWRTSPHLANDTIKLARLHAVLDFVLEAEQGHVPLLQSANRKEQ